MAALPPRAPDARNVLLIVWDTVRASNLSLYGYGRPTTPNLERLAGRGVRFDLAFSTSSWTLPSHMPACSPGDGPTSSVSAGSRRCETTSPRSPSTWHSQGYDTAGFVANLEYCGRETGLARGFAHYEDFPFDVYDIFARYVALGHRIEIASWALVLDRLLEKCLGAGMTLPPARGSMRRTPRRWTGPSWRGSHGGRRRAAPSLPS